MSNLQNFLTSARDGSFALGHFNFSESVTLRAIVQACAKLRSPVFIGTSEGEAGFLGYAHAVALRDTWRASSGLPVFLNADHHKSFESAKLAVDAGYDSVHIDGSTLSLDENIALTRKVVQYAREVNADISVEGEVGYLRGASQLLNESVEINPQDMTSPQDALRFVEKTEVDRFAVVIGNLHGISLQGNPRLNLPRLREIREAVPNTFLTLHGGSGTSDEDVQGALSLGITNVHVNTEIRLSFFQGLWEQMQANPQETTPYKYFAPAVEAAQAVVEEKLRLFGAENLT
jgi:fructose-bisphosphate aldolase, class II